jgi:hypothetical protein
MTDEEILLWSVFFEILNDQQDEAMRKAKRR